MVHHSSKGNQAGKSVTDVGSGAGAISRGADCHCILRPHKVDGVIVLDAAVRSFAPIKAACYRREYPLFLPEPSLNPADLWTGKSPRTQPGASNQSTEPFPDHKTIIDVVLKYASGSNPEKQKISKAAKDDGVPKSNVYRWLEAAEKLGFLKPSEDGKRYTVNLVPPPQSV